MTTEPRLLSIEDAAECMAVSADSVWNEIEAGRLPCVRIGRRKLVPLAGIDWYVIERAELGSEMWQDAIAKAVSEAVTRTEQEPATKGRTGNSSRRQLSIAGRGSRG